MSKLPSQRDETLGGYIVHGIPFPIGADEESLEFLKKMAPIQIEQEYKITELLSVPGQGTEVELKVPRGKAS